MRGKIETKFIQEKKNIKQLKNNKRDALKAFRARDRLLCLLDSLAVEVEKPAGFTGRGYRG